jgi:hypothetical protein
MFGGGVSVQNRSCLTGGNHQLRPKKRRDSGQGQLKRLKNGQFLKVGRAVHSQDGSGTVHMVFRNEGANLTKATAEFHAN